MWLGIKITRGVGKLKAGGVCVKGLQPVCRKGSHGSVTVSIHDYINKRRGETHVAPQLA